jgi:hypothetical protein
LFENGPERNIWSCEGKASNRMEIVTHTVRTFLNFVEFQVFCIVFRKACDLEKNHMNGIIVNPYESGLNGEECHPIKR